jgi:hypothetical protein
VGAKRYARRIHEGCIPDPKKHAGVELLILNLTGVRVQTSPHSLLRQGERTHWHPDRLPPDPLTIIKPMHRSSLSCAKRSQGVLLWFEWISVQSHADGMTSPVSLYLSSKMVVDHWNAFGQRYFLENKAIPG